MTRKLGLLALALLVAPLAGCGRVGPPRAPGPASEIIYPRAYPTPPKAADGAPTAIAPATVVPSVPLAVPTR